MKREKRRQGKREQDLAAWSTRYWVSLAWAGVNRAARWARERGLIRARRLPVRTIGVGNVQAGGTGKTPLTIQIAREAIEKGLLVGILTRGYRSAWERGGGMITPDDPDPAPELCGDEAALVRDRCPQAWIGVGADRSARFAAMRSAAALRLGREFDLILLDDAFQHWKIACDQYVVAVTDAEFGERVFRERHAVISAEDLVVLTKGEAFPPGLENHPRKIRVRYRFADPDREMRYHFVAALGDPERARRSLEGAGYRIEAMTVFPDHHGFDRVETERILSEARALGRRVLLSGKDWMKWRALGVFAASVTVVEPKLEIVEGAEIWRSTIWGLFDDPTP